jgi:hypothetical protein
MVDIRWKDSNGNQSGVFEVQQNDTWESLSQVSLKSNVNVEFDVHSKFDSGTPSYVTFVTMMSDSLALGFKLAVPSTVVSLTSNSGTSSIVYRASVLVSDDPKINITYSPGTVKQCTMSWDGQSWTFSGDGAPTAGCEFNVSASQVTIVVNNSQSGTSTSIYHPFDTTLRTGGIDATTDGTSLTKTVSLASGSAVYIANVFRKLDASATLRVKS